jgi:NAD(P)-dependent dehydrogenase (short-subunit alcohol dehydrogenase family)
MRCVQRELTSENANGDEMGQNLLDLMHPELLPPHDWVEKRVDELLDLRGRRAVVIGGGGKNLGQAIVHRLAGLGASVAVVDLPQAAEAAQKVASDARERWGVPAVAIEADGRDWDGIHGAAQQAAEQLGGLDIWVNSGGAGTSVTYFADTTQGAIDGNMSGFVTPTLYGTHAALSVMLPQKRGRIINISSAAGFNAVTGLAAYGAAKAAVIAFTEFVAKEIGPEGVTIAGIAPGSMLGDAQREMLAGIPAGGDDAKMMQQVFAKTSLGRLAYPEEVANVVAFLASDAGAYIHGTTIRVAGGG